MQDKLLKTLSFQLVIGIQKSFILDYYLRYDYWQLSKNAPLLRLQVEVEQSHSKCTFILLVTLNRVNTSPNQGSWQDKYKSGSPKSECESPGPSPESQASSLSHLPFP